jgi:hypothetical protein
MGRRRGSYTDSYSSLLKKGPSGISVGSRDREQPPFREQDCILNEFGGPSDEKPAPQMAITHGKP